MQKMKTTQLIAFLNAIDIGEMDKIRAKLGEASGACLELNQDELARKLDEAGEALAQADMKTYHKRVKTVIARLGHVK